MLLRPLLGSEQHGCCAVRQRGGVTSRHGGGATVLFCILFAKHRLEASKLLHRGIRAEVGVAVDTQVRSQEVVEEAFLIRLSQVLATLKAWEDETYCRERLGLDKPLGSIDRSKLNVKGSSLAAGHPFAATGARILASAAKMLEENGGGRTLVSVCAAGGQGVVAILER